MQSKDAIAIEEIEIFRALERAQSTEPLTDSPVTCTAASIANATGIARSRVASRLRSLIKRGSVEVSCDNKGRKRYRAAKAQPCPDKDCELTYGHGGGHRFGIYVPYAVANIFGFVRRG